MIASFGDKTTEDFYHGHQTRRVQKLPADIHAAALRKLDLLNAARQLADLRVPPGNRLEKLKGSLEGFYSIRVNDQWRIIFHWFEATASDVSLTDYH